MSKILSTYIIISIHKTRIESIFSIKGHKGLDSIHILATLYSSPLSTLSIIMIISLLRDPKREKKSLQFLDRYAALNLFFLNMWSSSSLPLPLSFFFFSIKRRCDHHHHHHEVIGW